MFHHNAHLFGRSGINRLMFTTAIVLLLAFVAVSINAQDDGESVLRVGMLEPIQLDPAIGTNDPEILLNRSIYDYLIETLPDNTVGPNLATNWEISDDGLSYTFTLRDDVTFHDGSQLTAADVAYTYNRLKELESPALGLLGEFEVEAADDYTVLFTLAQPNADFIFGVASRHAAILKDGAENVNVIEGENFANFNGTGPFIVEQYSPGELAVLRANDNYWADGQPGVDRLEFIFIDDTLTQVNALRDGAVDFIFKIAVDQIEQIEAQDNLYVLEASTNQHPLIRLRADAGHIGEDPRIREAFKLATDRDELLEVVQLNAGVIGNNDPIGPAYGAFYDSSIQQPDYDPERACELIQEATGQERLSSDFYVVDAFNYEELGTRLQQQWAEGCIDVELLVRAEGIYYGDDEWLTVDLGITGWGDRPVPQGYLNEAYLPDAPFAETHWVDDELVTLIEDAAVTADPDARAEIYSQIQQIFADRGPVIIPWFATLFGAASERVEGLTLHPFAGQTDLRTVTVSE